MYGYYFAADQSMVLWIQNYQSFIPIKTEIKTNKI